MFGRDMEPWLSVNNCKLNIIQVGKKHLLNERIQSAIFSVLFYF